MVSTRRNFNIEEVNTDLMDIPYIKNQTFSQKIIFFGGIAAGIALLMVGRLVLHLPIMVNAMLFLGFAFIGVLFGGNYNQDLTLFQYLKYKFTHSEKYLRPVSTEDVKYIEGKSKEIEDKDRETARSLQTRDPQESKRMLKKLLIFLLVFIIAIASVVVFSKTKKTDTVKENHRIIVSTQ